MKAWQTLAFDKSAFVFHRPIAKAAHPIKYDTPPTGVIIPSDLSPLSTIMYNEPLNNKFPIRNDTVEIKGVTTRLEF